MTGPRSPVPAAFGDIKPAHRDALYDIARNRLDLEVIVGPPRADGLHTAPVSAIMNALADAFAVGYGAGQTSRPAPSQNPMQAEIDTAQQRLEVIDEFLGYECTPELRGILKARHTQWAAYLQALKGYSSLRPALSMSLEGRPI